MSLYLYDKYFILSVSPAHTLCLNMSGGYIGIHTLSFFNTSHSLKSIMCLGLDDIGCEVNFEDELIPHLLFMLLDKLMRSEFLHTYRDIHRFP